jgi:hypothetical protein
LGAETFGGMVPLESASCIASYLPQSFSTKLLHKTFISCGCFPAVFAQPHLKDTQAPQKISYF